MEAGFAIDLTRRRPGLFEALNTAQSASDRSCDRAAPGNETARPAGLQPQANLHSEFALDEFDAVDLVRPLDNPFCDAEANAEILEVRRRRHHDGVSRSVIGQSDPLLFR